MNGVNVARSTFNRIYFDVDKTKEGLKALKNYHEKWNETLNVGQGAVHDWSSPGATAFIYYALALNHPSFNSKVDTGELQRAQEEYCTNSDSYQYNPFE
jgi:phage terminase large subunit